MLGEILFEEKGRTSGIRVLSSDPGETTVEVSIQAKGRILNVKHTSLWTYWSKTRADGSIYGEAKGFMTTKDGDVIHMVASGAAKAVGPDGAIHYRGAVYFQTTSAKFSRLNGGVGVHEYDVDAEGNTAGKVWEWK